MRIEMAYMYDQSYNKVPVLDASGNHLYIYGYETKTFDNGDTTVAPVMGALHPASTTTTTTHPGAWCDKTHPLSEPA